MRQSILFLVKLRTRLRIEGRRALQGLRSSRAPLTGLERALSSFQQELTPKDAARLRIVITGHVRELAPALQEKLFLIIREALTNALQHSQAATIEAEIEYLPGRLWAAVRDNGIGIDCESLWDGPSRAGLTGMCERAECIGAQVQVWSKAGAGTEVEISLLV